MRLLGIALLLSLSALGQDLVPYAISTVAGSGDAGDGGPAARALIANAQGLTFDSSGNLFVLDKGGSALRKISPDGTISAFAELSPRSMSSVLAGPDGLIYVGGSGGIWTVDSAGTVQLIVGAGGPSGFGGDGGPAGGATMSTAAGLAFDAAGNLLFSDYFNNRIRKVTRAGVISTFAGSGTGGFAGDNGPALEARLNFPSSLAFDATGNLYFFDASNFRVRRIKADTNVITTVAGDGRNGPPVAGNSLSSPVGAGTETGPVMGLTIDKTGRILMTAGSAILALTGDTTLSILAGAPAATGYSGDGGPASAARLNRPMALAIDASGAVVFADSLNNCIRRITPDGLIATIAGRSQFSGDGGPATEALLRTPLGLARDSEGSLYVSDSGNNRIRKIAADGTITTIGGNGNAAPSGNGGPAIAAGIGSPGGLKMDGEDNLYIIASGALRRIGKDGIIRIFTGGFGPGGGNGGPATSATFGMMGGFGIDSTGSVYISDAMNRVIRKVTPDGIISAFAGTGVSGTTGDGGPATAAALQGPRGIGFDKADNLYFIDGNNRLIRKISSAGIISTIAGNGTRGEPVDGAQATATPIAPTNEIAVDPDGNVYFANASGATLPIYRVTPAGVVNRIAGTLDAVPYSDDTGPALAASVSAASIALGPGGEVWFTDPANHRIRKLTPDQATKE